MKDMYKELSLLLMLFLILPAAVNAQGIAYYSGMVKNTDNQPIENVTSKFCRCRPGIYKYQW